MGRLLILVVIFWGFVLRESVFGETQKQEKPDGEARHFKEQILGEAGLWGLDGLDGKLDGRYRFRYEGDGVRVYLIDSRIIGGHFEFEGRVKPGLELCGQLGFPHPGWGDDLAHGVLSQALSHGTHVASVIMGKTAGVAKKALLIPAYDRRCDDEIEYLSALKAILEIEKTMKSGRSVINISETTDRKPEFDAEIEKVLRALTDEGVVVVVAAGNRPRGRERIDQTWPAYFDHLPGVIAVGNLNISGLAYAQQSIGASFFAPGTEIFGAVIDGKLTKTYKNLTGTSMAAPMVSGVVAQIMEAYPEMSAYEIEALLYREGREVPYTGGARSLRIPKAMANQNP